MGSKVHGSEVQKLILNNINLIEPQKRAHSPQLAAGLASESENSKLPYGRRFPAACCGELQLMGKEKSAERLTLKKL